jgi:ribonuclease Z
MRPRFDARLINGPFGDPGMYVDFRHASRALLFDLGDNAPLAPRHLLRVTHAFVSHTHMDHFVGFDRLVRICIGRHTGVHCFGPPGFVDQVEHKLAAYTWNLVHNYTTEFALTATEIDTDGRTRSARFSTAHAFARESLADGRAPDGVLLDEPGFRVRCALLDHRTPCLGFAVEESVHVNVWKNHLAALGLRTGPWLARAKQAILAGGADDEIVLASWREQGEPVARRVALGELRREAIRCVPGGKIAYVTDVVYHADNQRRIVELARGANQLFIEAVFLDADGTHAQRKQHLTARQAGQIARACGAKDVTPFHFSPRYIGREADLMAELHAAALDDAATRIEGDDGAA